MSIKLIWESSGNIAEVNASKQLKVVPETDAVTNPWNVGAFKMFTENDGGSVTWTPDIKSPETDEDFRMRSADEVLLEDETFNYTAQNTGKYTMPSTTMASTFSASGWLTNSGSITTTTTGIILGSYAYFPIFWAHSTYVEGKMSFSATSCPSNTIVYFGTYIRQTQTTAPTDWVYFQMSSSGLQWVVNSNGSITTTSPMSFTPVSNQVYKCLITISRWLVKFWINDVLYGSIETPTSNWQPLLAVSAPINLQHSIIWGAAGWVYQVLLKSWNVSISGTTLYTRYGNSMNWVLWSYQGLGGGTMGSLATYPNSTQPTAALPSNTALTANLLAWLWGQLIETDTLATGTDWILMSYQVPAGTVAVQGRRLRVGGIRIDSFVQTALTGGGYNACFSLAFWHTAVSLATAEAATTKAARRIALGAYTVASGAVVTTKLDTIQLTFNNAIYVNPWEFIQLVKKKIGTAPSAWQIQYLIYLDYSWE